MTVGNIAILEPRRRRAVQTIEGRIYIDHGGSPEIGLEEPGTSGLGDCTPGTETLGEGDRCITIDQVAPATGYAVQLWVQGSPVEAVVDTGAEVSVLGTERYNSLERKPPIKKHIILMQPGAGTRLEGFIAGPFSTQVGENVHNVDSYVAPLKDPMLLRVVLLRERKAKLDL